MNMGTDFGSPQASEHGGFIANAWGSRNSPLTQWTLQLNLLRNSAFIDVTRWKFRAWLLDTPILQDPPDDAARLAAWTASATMLGEWYRDEVCPTPDSYALFPITCYLPPTDRYYTFRFSVKEGDELIQPVYAASPYSGQEIQAMTFNAAGNLLTKSLGDDHEVANAFRVRKTDTAAYPASPPWPPATWYTDAIASNTVNGCYRANVSTNNNTIAKSFLTFDLTL